MESMIVAEREIEWLRSRMAEKNELLAQWEERWREVSFVPWDRQAEENAIGCSLLAPGDLAGRAFKQTRAEKFYDPYHSWLWGRLSWAHRTVVWEAGAVMRHFRKDGQCRRAEEFGGDLTVDLYRMAVSQFYWNLDYYLGKVEVSYRHRIKIQTCKRNLDTLIQAAQRSAAKGYQI